MTKLKNKTAKVIKDLSSEFQGKALLYSLSDPVTFRDDEHKHHKTNFVIVSQILNSEIGTNETFVFPSDEEGEVWAWHELKGSTYGQAHHSTVLFELGGFFID